MKKFNLFFIMSFFIVFFIIFFTQISAQYQEQETTNPDKEGKVFIQILDPEGVPVKEEFEIVIYSSFNYKDLDEAYKITKKITKTNKEGRLIVFLNPGLYYLQYLPLSHSSKFAFEPSPLLSEFNREPVVVESSKITEVYKKVKLGGYLKIILVDTNGNKLNFEERFKTSKDGMQVKVFSENGLLGYIMLDRKRDKELTGDTDNLNDGELTIGRLYPGEYGFTVFFGILGYQEKQFKNIIIKSNQTTVQEVLVDLNNHTGVEGFITDQSGQPLENLYVKIDWAVFKTNKDGYYRLVGLDEGENSININFRVLQTNILTHTEGITIIKNSIIQKNFSFNIER